MQIRLSDHFSFGRLLRFTLPSIAMMILTSLYSVADGLFVSNMIGDIGLSAVNIMFPVAMLISAVGFMLGTGGSAVVARTLGEGRPDMANRFFSMFVFAVILFGGILSARRHKANCFRAGEPRPYERNDSIIHVLTQS